MSNKGHNLLSIPKFYGDYEHWKMLMENLLRSKEWWHLIEPGYVEPAAGTRETEAKKAAREQLKLKDLKKKYQGHARVQRAQLQALKREFEVLEMKECEGVTDYIARLMVVVNNMGNNGEVMRESQIIEKISRTLTKRFNYIMVSIEESKDINRMTVDELQSSLIVHEQKFRRKIKEA
ncbi:hypothetical protein OSB04_031347 [Centaurea solstitialis]|uniref:Retrovirus-related Pol polyprotein from transposon TNT 1-94 n=1 Tax=Centaurea solstitialis TaxID=347529 RepID=A0AA38SAK2_9ASTR|nr:hypothetical protein OSB04_031347 [Centaurea solstitialis]